MATGAYSWSQTAATNSTADSTINWAEGQAPSSVNDSARAMMAVVAKWRDDLSGVQPANVIQTSGGSANAQTLTTNGSIAALTNGWTVAFKAGFTNTGDCTFAVDGLTAKHFNRISGTNLIGGEIIAGCVYMATYHQPADTWVLRGVPPIAGEQLLTYGTASGATLDVVLTGYTAFRAIKFVLTAMKPATDAVTLYMRTSTNGGSTYDASSGNYQWAFQAYGSFDSAVSDGSTSSTRMELTASIGNSTGEQANLSVVLYNQTATEYTTVSWDGNYISENTSLVTVQGSGVRATQADVDAARFLFSSGNITSGKYAVYGIF
jgi:hypothetical protein